jgi:hypothetical protein
MTQFKEGQQVEVLQYGKTSQDPDVWRKAKLGYALPTNDKALRSYRVEFPDGTRGVFDADHIREAQS